jgi:hypothetical protein
MPFPYDRVMAIDAPMALLFTMRVPSMKSANSPKTRAIDTHFETTNFVAKDI